MGATLEQLLDAETIALAAVDRLIASVPTGLAEFDRVRGVCGVYLLFAAANAHVLYEPLAGRHPVYVGAAADLTARLRVHSQSLDAVEDLEARHFRAVVIETTQLAGGAYLERILIEIFRPVWNQPPARGFGARPQGHVRDGHGRSPWDTLHPGRRLAQARASHDNQAVAAFVRSWVTCSGASLGMWPEGR